jgi:uncharacterized protein involved in propanediol utilization
MRSSTSLASSTGAIREGRAIASGHHGELLQGLFEQSGSLHRGLITLPCASMRSEAEVALDPAAAVLEVFPPWRRKALTAARLALEELDAGAFGGRLVLRSNIRPGHGYGSSTSDVAAAIRAVAAALESTLPLNVVARLAVAAEVAADSTVFGEPVLFAQREGCVLEHYGRDWPTMSVLAFRTVRRGSSAGVDTLELPPASYSQREIRAFRQARSALARAFGQGDVETIGEVATLSAEINQRHLPIPNFVALLRLRRKHGAVGVQIAHSGDVAGLLFGEGAEDRLNRAVAGLREIGLEPWQFDVPGRSAGAWAR